MIDTKERTRRMKAIWRSVGLILLSMGTVIFLTGLYEVFFRIKIHTVLAHLYPNIWWGSILILVGMIFFLTNRR
jgi:hypothetical protein